MSNQLGTGNQTRRLPFKTGILSRTGRYAAYLAICWLVSIFVFRSLLAQPPDKVPDNVPVNGVVRPPVRFESQDVLFLGLSDTKSQSRDASWNDYSLISIPCKGSTSSKPRNYRFAFVVPNALERDLLDDSADGIWQRWDIVSAALVAEGLNNQQRVDAYRNQVASVVRQVPSQEKNRLVQTVFETLHSRLLTGKYDVGCTNLAQAIETGDFNCVSATILFHAMAQRSGLDVCGLEMRGHALSRVRFDQQVIDLETTCADWFNLSESERTRSVRPTNAGHDTAYNVARQQTPPLIEPSLNAARLLDNVQPLVSTDPADLPPTLPLNEVPLNLREISDVQLIATIYYNRGVDELVAGHFSAATVANLKALHLDPHNDNVWRNLMATINNWAIACASKGDYLNAAQLLDEGRFIDDSYELFRSNQVHTFYHWVVDVANRRDYDKALTLLQMAEDRLPNQDNLRFLNYTVRRKMANEFFASQEDRMAFDQFDLAEKIAPVGVNVSEAEIVDVTQYVRRLIDNRKLSRALWLIDRELERHTPATAMVQSLPAPLPNAPEVSPLFNLPVVLDGDEKATTPSTAVPHPYIAARPANDPPPGETQSITTKRQPVKPELLEQLQLLRAGAVVAWADEPFKQRDYPESIRRLTIGEPEQHLLSDEQIRLLRQSYADWAAALRSENRHAEAQTVLKMAADSPYLRKPFAKK